MLAAWRGMQHFFGALMLLVSGAPGLISAIVAAILTTKGMKGIDLQDFQLKLGMAKKRNPSNAKTDAGAACVIKGVATEWDLVGAIRERVRDGGTVLDPSTPPKQEDITVCVLNKDLLSPLLSKICLAERRLPALDDLRDEVASLLTMNKRHGDELVKEIEDTAYHLKKLCGFVKTKARRKEVSVASCLNQPHRLQ